MAISTDKLVTLAQLRSQAERIKQEFTKYTLTSELGSLALKSEVSEADLSEALKSVINGKMDEADSMTAEAIMEAINTAVANAEHLRFEEAATVPAAADAETNVLYLVKNTKTGFYDIYALVGEKVVQLDDTTVDLSNYATIDDLNDVVAGQASVYEATKDNLNSSDSDVIDSYFTTQGGAAKKGDVFVIDTIVNGKTYEQSAYGYNGESWVAMTGNVDADKVIMRGNITMAGDYTQVGNKTKVQNGTAEFTTDGKSVAAILTDIFSKRLQPTITAQPSVQSFSLTGAGAVEAGTVVSEAKYSAAALNAGSYTYGPATEVAVDEKISGAGHLGLLVVESAPSAANAKANTIYFVPKNSGVSGNQYDEYMLIKGSLERIGDAEVDLSDYVTQKYVAKADDTLITEIFNTLQASSERYVGTANLAKFWALVKPLVSSDDTAITDLTARVELLELCVMNGEIEGNPFYITFDTLDGCTVTGVWNTENNRIDF